MGTGKRKNTTTLYRVIDAGELTALQALHFRKFPPFEGPAFYPVLDKRFALEALAQKEAAPAGSCYLATFCICAAYVRSFEVQTLSGEVYEELWVPAEELPFFNEKIVGKIRLVAGA